MIAQKVREEGSTQQVRAGQTDGGRKAESGINWDEDECGRGGELKSLESAQGQRWKSRPVEGK